MIKEWFDLSDDRRKEIFTQTAQREGIPVSAVEKDWWVTLVLHTAFELDFSEHLAFKGGTSLSKGWDLINRFSEDIDLVIDMNYLGFNGDPKPKNITKLRKNSHKFVRDKLCEALTEALSMKGVLDFEVSPNDEPNTTVDPNFLIISYRTLVEYTDYLLPEVKLEVGGRSLMEPCEITNIQSLVGKHFADKKFADNPAPINTVLPKRTFLEKAFLLHEEFQKPIDEIRTHRMSRHLYDLERLMDTDHGKEALADKVLYSDIVNHRSIFLKMEGIDYDSHLSDKIDFLPPEAKMDEYRRDYRTMQEGMFHGDSLSFDDLIGRVTELRTRFQKKNRVPFFQMVWKMISLENAAILVLRQIWGRVNQFEIISSS